MPFENENWVTVNQLVDHAPDIWEGKGTSGAVPGFLFGGQVYQSLERAKIAQDSSTGDVPVMFTETISLN